MYSCIKPVTLWRWTNLFNSKIYSHLCPTIQLVIHDLGSYKVILYRCIYIYCSMFTHTKETSDSQLTLKIMAVTCSLSSRLGQQWGSKCVCVQETKTLHAQHKQYILKYTCVFPKKLTVNINSKHSLQLCSWHDFPIQSPLETLIRLMELRGCELKYKCMT